MEKKVKPEKVFLKLWNILMEAQKKKNANGEWVHEHSITIPLEEAGQFLEVLKRILNSKRTKELLKKV